MTRKIAVVDLVAASRNEVMALTMMELHDDVQRVDDTQGYDKAYADTRPDLMLLGLDADPGRVLDVARYASATHPHIGFIAYASTPTPELIMQAMAADARRFLTYPFTADALSTTLASVAGGISATGGAQPLLSLPPATIAPPKGQVVALFSPKGGVGTTTIAVNLACALRPRRVLVIDANISYGNLGMFLDTHTSRSMIELAGEPGEITREAVEPIILTHGPSGVRLLLSPLKPEDADQIKKEHLRAIIDVLRPQYDYVIVDTWPSYEERVLAVLDTADRVIMPVGPDYAALKNAGAFLRVAGLLGYPREKIMPVLMRADTVDPKHLENAEKYLKRSLDYKIVSDGLRVTASINKGQPFVLSEPQVPVSRNIIDLARLIDGRDSDIGTPIGGPQPFVGVVKRIFARRVA